MINIQGFNLVTYVQKKEVIITSCYITPILREIMDFNMLWSIDG